MLCLSFDDKECALMITLYLMKFDLMGSMIGEWILYWCIVEYALFALNDVERGRNTCTLRFLSI